MRQSRGKYDFHNMILHILYIIRHTDFRRHQRKQNREKYDFHDQILHTLYIGFILMVEDVNTTIQNYEQLDYILNTSYSVPYTSY